MMNEYKVITSKGYGYVYADSYYFLKIGGLGLVAFFLRKDRVRYVTFGVLTVEQEFCGHRKK